jgi:branched-chain amino acid transport system ATP-binding protein
VEFAHATVLDPAVMLVEERSMKLEPKVRRLVFEILHARRNEGRTILLVEERARSGLEIADQRVVLEPGRVRREGTGITILADPSVGAIYMCTAGRPQSKVHVAPKPLDGQQGDAIGSLQEEG